MISIIIPIYNVEKYLTRCLDSIRIQTYTDWECLLVDDGSRDNSPMICEQYADLDSRFRVIHQENQGVSAARNTGLEHAQGEYVSFVDSDDWVDEWFLKTMASEMTREVDLVVGGIIYGDTEHNVIYRMAVQQGDTSRFLHLDKDFVFNGVHRKLYRRDIIERYRLRYDVSYDYGEDLMFVFSYLRHCQSLIAVPSAHYHYTIENEGALTRRVRPNQFDIDYQQWQIKRDFYAERLSLDADVQAHLAHLLWGIVIDGVFYVKQHKADKKNYLKKVLGVEEINQLKQFPDETTASFWIKFSITQRLWWVFKFLLKL